MPVDQTELIKKVKAANGQRSKIAALDSGLIATLREAVDIADLNRMLDAWEQTGRAEAFAEVFKGKK